MREEKKSDKIVAIYEAIQELVTEGVDLKTVRVSDIAAKAGIGKGTTYEYFSSKEEMIVKAIVYLVKKMVNQSIREMDKQTSFKDKFMMYLTAVEEKGEQRACILKYMSMLHDLNLCQQMHDVLVSDEDAQRANPMCIIRYLLDSGITEGIFADKYPKYYMEMTMFSHIMAFVMFLDDDLNTKDCTSVEMKNALYDGICRELRAEI